MAVKMRVTTKLRKQLEQQTGNYPDQPVNYLLNYLDKLTNYKIYQDNTNSQILRKFRLTYALLIRPLYYTLSPLILFLFSPLFRFSLNKYTNIIRQLKPIIKNLDKNVRIKSLAIWQVFLDPRIKFAGI